MSSVTRDATSGIYAPATLAEWTTTLQVAGIASGGPSFLWLFDAASGGITDVIGSLLLSATGTPTYQDTRAGWSRKFITMADAQTQRFSSSNAALPDLSASSFLGISYISTNSAPAATRNVMTIGTSGSQCTMGVTTTPVVRTQSGANTTNGSTTIGTSVLPWTLQSNKTAGTTTGFTDTDKMAPTFGTPSGKGISIGPVTGTLNSPPCSYGYSAWFVGAAAEVTTAQIKKLLQTLGWTIAWS